MSNYSNMRNLSRETQEISERLLKKEFWLVDNSQNFIRELQDILDEYYNEYENCYVAEVSISQNTSRLVIRCNLCNAPLSSYDPFKSHNNGKTHKKLVNQACSSKDRSSPEFPIVRFKSSEELDNPFEIDTLEYELFETSHDVIGYQFLYREIFDKGERFTCQLCCKKDDKSLRMKRRKAFKHVTSEEHSLQYFKIKFDRKANLIPYAELRKYIEDVKNKEGKIPCKIFTIDSTKDLERKRSVSIDRIDSSKNESDSLDSGSLSHESLQSQPVMETVDDFMSLTSRHMDHFKGNRGDNIIAELQNDLDALDLLVGTAKVLSQKIYSYSTQECNRRYENDAKSLLQKSEQLKPVINDQNDHEDASKS